MKYGLIGEKLGHSFSAEIHRQLFDYTYELKELTMDELADFIRSREFAAINVTIPYKETVMSMLDDVDNTALQIGAANTVVNRNGRLIGYNTDFLGLRALIERNGMDLQNKVVLILGSGGTSKTAMAVAESLGCRRAVRVSRIEREGCITYRQAKERFLDADFIINTTPSGMYPDVGESAVDLADFPSLCGVVDVVYNPLRTKLVCDAIAMGIPAVGGLYMLVAQAAFAAELFTGESVQEEKIEGIYKHLLSLKQNIVLIGMPGCGKTTIGKALAEEMGMTFVDTDEEVIRVEDRAISEIFSAEGEPYFRRVEADVIRRVSAQQGCVIATGGGAVLDAGNMSLLRENGRLFFLDRPLDRLCATPDRPLSANQEALERLFKERYALYCAACDRRIVTDEPIDIIVKQIREDMMG